MVQSETLNPEVFLAAYSRQAQRRALQSSLSALWHFTAACFICSQVLLLSRACRWMWDICPFNQRTLFLFSAESSDWWTKVILALDLMLIQSWFSSPLRGMQDLFSWYHIYSTMQLAFLIWWCLSSIYMVRRKKARKDASLFQLQKPVPLSSLGNREKMFGGFSHLSRESKHALV